MFFTFSSQKVHVQQFLATEDALNKAAEAKNVCQKLLKRLHGNGDVVVSSSHSLGVGGTSQNVGSLRQFEVNHSESFCCCNVPLFWPGDTSLRGSFYLISCC